MCLSSCAVRFVPVAPIQTPDCVGEVRAVAGSLMFSPQGLCLGHPTPARPPPSSEGRPAGHVRISSPHPHPPPVRWTRGRKRASAGASGGHTSRLPFAPGRQAPRAPDTPRHDCHFTLCVGSWRAGPGSRTKGVQTRPTAKSKDSTAPWGRRLPGDQATSPLGWALNYSRRGQFRVIVCFP